MISYVLTVVFTPHTHLHPLQPACFCSSLLCCGWLMVPVVIKLKLLHLYLFTFVDAHLFLSYSYCTFITIYYKANFCLSSCSSTCSLSSPKTTVLFPSGSMEPPCLNESVNLSVTRVDPWCKPTLPLTTVPLVVYMS